MVPPFCDGQAQHVHDAGNIGSYFFERVNQVLIIQVFHHGIDTNNTFLETKEYFTPEGLFSYL